MSAAWPEVQRAARSLVDAVMRNPLTLFSLQALASCALSSCVNSTRLPVLLHAVQIIFEFSAFADMAAHITDMPQGSATPRTRDVSISLETRMCESAGHDFVQAVPMPEQCLCLHFTPHNAVRSQPTSARQQHPPSRPQVCPAMALIILQFFPTRVLTIAGSAVASASASRTATPPARVAGSEPVLMGPHGGAKSAAATPPDQHVPLAEVATALGDAHAAVDGAALADCGLDPAEAEALAAKLAALQGVLADELRELREQEIDIYVCVRVCLSQCVILILFCFTVLCDLVVLHVRFQDLCCQSHCLTRAGKEV
jgi:hypothetical protein